MAKAKQRKKQVTRRTADRAGSVNSPISPAAIGKPRKSLIGFLLRKAYQRNSAIWQTHCFDPQLTSVQAAALRSIYHQEPCSLIELGRAAAMDPATTRGVIDRLLERELIALSQDQRDRRKVMVRLQNKGRELVESLPPMLKKISALTMQPLNASERATLQRLLEKMTSADDKGGF